MKLGYAHENALPEKVYDGFRNLVMIFFLIHSYSHIHTHTHYHFWGKKKTKKINFLFPILPLIILFENRNLSIEKEEVFREIRNSYVLIQKRNFLKQNKKNEFFFLNSTHLMVIVLKIIHIIDQNLTHRISIKKKATNK